MKKLLSTALVISLILTTATACTKSDTPPTTQPTSTSTPSPTVSTGAADRTERITVSYSFWDGESKDDELGKAIEDKLNIDFELIPLSWDNPEQVSLFGATNSLPDVTSSYPSDEMDMFYSWIDQGLIRDIPYEMISKYPNLKRVVDNDAILQATKDVKGGKIWYLPRPESFENIYKTTLTGIYYRKDWLKAVGIDKVPETVDEFYNMLVAFKTKDPDGNGKNDTVPLAMQKFIPKTPNDYIFEFWGTNPMAWYKQSDNRWAPAYYTDAMLEPLKFYRKLYTEGLLDPEFTTVSRNQMMQLFSTNTAGAIVRNADTNWANTVIRRNFGAANEDKNMFECIDILPPLSGVAGQAPKVSQHLDRCGSYISANVSDEKLDRILDWAEFCLSDEGLDFNRYGVENLSYKRNGDNIELLLDPKTNEPFKFGAQCLMGLSSWDFDFAADPKSVNDYPAEIKEISGRWREAMNACVEPTEVAPLVISTPTKDELNIPVGDKFMQIIIGTDDVEKMFRDFQAECKAQEMETIIDEVTAEMSKLG